MNNSKTHLPETEYKTEGNLLNRNTDFSVVEAYKSIRTNIMYSMPKTEHGKVIVLTSASAGEGKTTTCINLALTFAQVNSRVLLIDCDLRKPKIHRYLKIDKKEGLSNVLCGFSELGKAIKVGVRENLDVLSAGEMPPNPAELLQTQEFERLINFLKTKYDYIFIDTPPVSLVTDATLTVKHSTGVVVLVKKNVTTYEMLDDSIEKLKTVGANIIGTVVIDGKENKKSRRYYHRNKYTYTYSDRSIGGK